MFTYEMPGASRRDIIIKWNYFTKTIILYFNGFYIDSKLTDFDKKVIKLFIYVFFYKNEICLNNNLLI